MAEDNLLSVSVVQSAIREQLETSNFRISDATEFSSLPRDRTLLAEDEYSFICIIVYETWTELEESWPDAQGELVSLLASRLAKSAPKAWDGYLVLICTNRAPSSKVVFAIERDTTRLRKIVATADNLHTTSDIVSVLEPFLPLNVPEQTQEYQDLLSTLPDLLDDQVPSSAVRAVVSAYQNMEPPLDRLHRLRDEL